MLKPWALGPKDPKAFGSPNPNLNVYGLERAWSQEPKDPEDPKRQNRRTLKALETLSPETLHP